MRRGMLIGWLLGVTSVGIGALAGANWYEYKMLPPTECALFRIARYDPSPWVIAPEQPDICYVRRSVLSLR